MKVSIFQAKLYKIVVKALHAVFLPNLHKVRQNMQPYIISMWTRILSPTTPPVLDKSPQQLCTCSFQLHCQPHTNMSAIPHHMHMYLQLGVCIQCIATIIASSPGHSQVFQWMQLSVLAHTQGILSTQLTVGGFTQLGVARGLIEMPANSEKGFSHRFLWFFPNPLFEKFSNLGEVDREFVQKMNKFTLDVSSLPRTHVQGIN